MNTNQDHCSETWAINHKGGTVLESIGQARHPLDKSETLWAKIEELKAKLSNDEIVNYLLLHYRTTLIRRHMQEQQSTESPVHFISELVKQVTKRKRGGQV